MQKYFIFMAIFLFSIICEAGELARNTKIIKIGNTSDGSDAFYIRTSGGIGPCVGINIVFPMSNAPSVAFHNRAYSLALTAFTTKNQNVRIHNFIDDNCREATFIEMSE